MAHGRADRSSLNRRLLWVSVGLMLAGCLVGIAVPAGARWDFANFYDAGQKVAAGQVSDLYDPTSTIRGSAPQGSMRFWGPPISALFYVPLSWFPAGTALVLFKIENVLAFAAAFAVLFVFGRRFVPDSPADRERFAALFAFLCLIYQPFWTVFRVGGQTTPTVLLLMTLGLVFHTTLRDWASAVCVVLATLIKPALAPALLCLLCLSGPSFLMKTAAVLLAAGLASLILLGWPINLAFVDLMRTGVQYPFPWYYNSSLFILIENLQSAFQPRPGTGVEAQLFPALTYILKAVVLATVLFLVLKSRRRRWTIAARRHFAVVMSILFFLWWSSTLWEHYLALLFIPLIYVVASARRFRPSARVLIAAIFALSIAQNLVFTDWLRRHVSFDSAFALLAIAMVKAGPLLLMLVFVWRHYEELFDSYEAAAWSRVQPAAPGSRVP